jgi:hypothetical protein
MCPAFARDLSDRPLFHLIAEGYDTYYRLDEETGKFVLSDYDDELDSRGVYYDYLPGFGLSDNAYKRFHHIVSCIVEMAKEDADAYIESGVPPLTTGSDAPATAAPKPNTTTPPTTQAPPVSSGGSTETETPSGSDTGAPETQAPATQAPEQSSAQQEPQAPTPVDNSEGSGEIVLARPPRTEILFATDTVAQLLTGIAATEAAPAPETSAAPAGSAPTSDTSKGTEAVTTSGPKYSNYTMTKDGLFVSVEVMERRWGFGIYDYKYTNEYKSAPDEAKLSNFYKYYRLYNFKDGLCAAVDRDGRMSFRNTAAKAIVTRTGEYYGQSNRKFLTGYAEPLLRGVDAIGSLYFDEGYVMVRQIDIDHKYKNTISGDYQYLVDDKGEKFPIPAGYDLLAYSDGVLLLGRGGYYGYYSTEGKWIAQPIFTYARPFAEGLGVLGFSGSKKGVIDREGNLIVPFKYDHISNVSCGTFAVYGEDGWKLIAKLEKQG